MLFNHISRELETAAIWTDTLGKQGHCHWSSAASLGCEIQSIFTDKFTVVIHVKESNQSPTRRLEQSIHFRYQKDHGRASAMITSQWS